MKLRILGRGGAPCSHQCLLIIIKDEIIDIKTLLAIIALSSHVRYLESIVFI